MRADRLVSALLLLQTRGRMTATELAAELETSVVTARRDLAALASAGIPVYPQPGRGGGWSLVGGARTDLSGLTAGEAQARTALRKLVRALPGPFRADAEAAADATMADPAGWGERDRTRPALLDLVQTAVIRRQRLRLRYAGRTGEHTERLADPWGLVDKDGTWYLVAGTGRGQRTFRVDRIVEAQPTGETVQRPGDFTLAGVWRDVVGEVERRRSTTWAEVLLPHRFAPILHDHFGRHCEVGETLADGRARVRVGAPTARDIARQLAGWGELAEVTGPPAVQAELARIGAELTARYG